jgi:hypothetical protein
VAPEPEGSSPCLQEPVTGPCPEPTGSTQHTPPDIRKIHSDPIFPSTPWSSEWSLSIGLSHQTLGILKERTLFLFNYFKINLFNPLKPNGYYMYQLLWQKVGSHFVFMGFV